MKARLFVMMLFLALGFTANAQVANNGEVAAKKEAVKEAVKAAKKEAVKGAKKEAVREADINIRRDIYPCKVSDVYRSIGIRKCRCDEIAFEILFGHSCILFFSVFNFEGANIALFPVDCSLCEAVEHLG